MRDVKKWHKTGIQSSATSLFCLQHSAAPNCSVLLDHDKNPLLDPLLQVHPMLRVCGCEGTSQ